MSGQLWRDQITGKGNKLTQFDSRCRSIIVGEVFTKALRRKDQAGHSSIDKSTVEADSEGAVPQEAEVPTIKVSDEAVPEQDAAKELSALEEELDKATSGKIMNLISSDTYQREFADTLTAQRSAVLTLLSHICSFGSS